VTGAYIKGKNKDKSCRKETGSKIELPVLSAKVDIQVGTPGLLFYFF